jgi:hypothetical protein
MLVPDLCPLDPGCARPDFRVVGKNDECVARSNVGTKKCPRMARNYSDLPCLQASKRCGPKCRSSLVERVTDRKAPSDGTLADCLEIFFFFLVMNATHEIVEISETGRVEESFLILMGRVERIQASRWFSVCKNGFVPGSADQLARARMVCKLQRNEGNSNAGIMF